jgi:hypothetical protein
MSLSAGAQYNQIRKLERKIQVCMGALITHSSSVGGASLTCGASGHLIWEDSNRV